MKKYKLLLVIAGLAAVTPAFAQGTADGTPNIGLQATENYLAEKPEGSGRFVAGEPQRNGSFFGKLRRVDRAGDICVL